MLISLDIFVQQYLNEFERGAAKAALAEHATTERLVGDWKTLWQKALAKAVQ